MNVSIKQFLDLRPDVQLSQLHIWEEEQAAAAKRAIAHTQSLNGSYAESWAFGDAMRAAHLAFGIVRMKQARSAHMLMQHLN